MDQPPEMPCANAKLHVMGKITIQTVKGKEPIRCEVALVRPHPPSSALY
jgi:hypothetical protein